MNEEADNACEAAAAAALEKTVADRKAKAERTQRHLKEQLQKARKDGLTAMAADGVGDLVGLVREAEARGVAGDDVACALGVSRLGSCLWYLGFIPGLIVNTLCALLSNTLIDETFDKMSIDGDSAAYFMMSLTLPVVLSVLALVICLGKGVRAAGSRGYWRTLCGYVVGASIVGLALVVRSLTVGNHLRLILYTV